MTSTNEYAGSIEFIYESSDTEHTPLSRDDILATALEDWRVFVGNPEETLPWGTSLKVSVNEEGDWVATVTMRWGRTG